MKTPRLFLLLIVLPTLLVLCSCGPTRFVKTWGGSSDDYIRAVAIDSVGSIYCVGYSQSFGAGKDDTLLLKYNSSGNLQWAKTWGGGKQDHFSGVVVNSVGDVYCVGYTNSFCAVDDGGDALLLKYKSSGKLQWVKTWGVSDLDWLSAAAIDSAGSTYCVGSACILGRGSDTLLLKYNSSGELQWAQTWGGNSIDSLWAVAVDSTNNIYCAGHSYGFGASDNALILKYDSSGNRQWVRTWHGPSDDRFEGLAVDSTGSIYTVGGTKNPDAGDWDALLLKYDSSGELKWAKTWRGGSDDMLYAVAIDPAAFIYCVGYTESFDTGKKDALFLKYDSSGELQWARTWGGVGEDRFQEVTVDSAGNVLFSGSTHSYIGTWQTTTTGMQNIARGRPGSSSGLGNTPVGTEEVPKGTLSSPMGSESGAGGIDTLLLKNW